jgi:hypothetical protein
LSIKSQPNHAKKRELKSFTMTLSFYSLKAYNYVRKTFQLALPHPSTVRMWYTGLYGQLGFTEEAFAALAVRVQEATGDGKQIVRSLMFDEMATRKHTGRNGQRFVGYLDVGSGVDDNSATVATEALDFTVVSLNSNWKLAWGYFLICGLSGAERAKFVNQSLLKLHDVGVCVRTVTCDDPSCNLTMIINLGVKFLST